MQDPRATNLIGNPQRISRRHMLSLGATAMAGAGLLQQLGIISAANAETFPDEEIQGLPVHNVYRLTIHCVGPLGFDPNATLAAREWATRSPQGTDAQGQIKFAHDPNPGIYGESLAWGPSLTAVQAVAMWYAEITKYDFNNPGFSETTGHFTQLVWASSRALGMSMARRGNLNLWVARYSPAGNISGQFPANVLPPLAGPLCAFLRPGSQQLIGTVPPAPEPQK
jgi:hypothetical protein